MINADLKSMQKIVVQSLLAKLAKYHRGQSCVFT